MDFCQIGISSKELYGIAQASQCVQNRLRLNNTLRQRLRLRLRLRGILFDFLNLNLNLNLTFFGFLRKNNLRAGRDSRDVADRKIVFFDPLDESRIRMPIDFLGQPEESLSLFDHPDYRK
jgi:hypothetical protein